MVMRVFGASLVALALFVLPASAELVKVKGTVESVTFPSEKAKRPENRIKVIVKTDGGKKETCYIPPRYWDEKAKAIKPGDEIKLTGTRVKKTGDVNNGKVE
jgi:hypothetical protein